MTAARSALIVGCGDVGCRLARRLIAAGTAVTGVVRSPASAAALGRSLDAWTAARGAPGSPERLQAHLAELFPEAPVSPPQRQEPASVSLLPGIHPPAR